MSLFLKKITLPGSPTGGKHEQSYNITVKGDIASTEQIKVEPQEEFTLSQANKDDVTASVSQTAKIFKLATDGSGTASIDSGICTVPFSLLNSTGGYTAENTGKVSVDTLSAGTWTGAFTFSILLDGGSSTSPLTIVSWAEGTDVRVGGLSPFRGG